MKRRLIGAVVIVAVVVIVLPTFLGHRSFDHGASAGHGSGEGQREGPGGTVVKSVTIPLSSSSGAGGSQPSSSAEHAPAAAKPAGASSATSPAPVAAQPSAPPKPLFSLGNGAAQASSAQANRAPAIAKPSATPPAPAAKPASVAPKSQPGGQWGVQVGSFVDIRRAHDLQQQLKAKGFATYITDAKVKGHLFHRVRVGPAASQAAAQQLQQRLKKVLGRRYRVIPER